MKINFKECNSQNFTPGRSQKVKYLVIHYTSNNGDTAKNNADYFAREKVGASAHYFCDESEIWQSVKDTDTAWHCGAKTYKHPECRNSNSIGIEICMNDKSGKVRQCSIDTAAELARYLMKRYGILIANVIRHHDVTGKYCPGPMVDDAALWDAFKKSLIKEDDDEVRYKYYDDMPDWAQSTFRRLIDAEIVKVNKAGEIEVYEPSVQPMVYLDRLCGGKIEKLPEAIKALQASE